MASLDKFLGDRGGLGDLVRSPGDCGGQEDEDGVWAHGVRRLLSGDWGTIMTRVTDISGFIQMQPGKPGGV